MTETVTESAPVVTPDYEDYWGNDETVKVPLPDGTQYFIIQPMNEGKKAQFQRMTNRDIIMEQKTQNARFKVDPAQERHELIKSSVVDWLMYRKDKTTQQVEEVRFTPDKLNKWLSVAPPHVVELVEHKIRLANPWLQAEMTVEQIDEEIDRLRELRQQREREEQGESDSANK